MKDIIGQALLDFQNNDYTADIVTTSSLDEEDLLPLPYLFRSYSDMPLIEQKALQLCRGKILDIGCGAGSHSLWLQKKGHVVKAMDTSKGAISVCKARGVNHAIHSNILDYQEDSFDTLLLMMNGIGIVGNLSGLAAYLEHFKTLLNRGGQLLLDSSDISYMFDKEDDGGFWVLDNNGYYGEVKFKMGYKGIQGDSFSWLYLDFNTLHQYALQCGWHCERILEGPHFDYLAKLTLKTY